jgi:hypothetical protein
MTTQEGIMTTIVGLDGYIANTACQNQQLVHAVLQHQHANKLAHKQANHESKHHNKSAMTQKE